MAKTIYEHPSKETVNFCYNGILEFHPDAAAVYFGREPKPIRGIDVSKYFSNQARFDRFLLDVTGSGKNIDKAIEIINLWMQGGTPKQTVPQQINSLVEDMAEQENTKTSEFKKKSTVKKLEIEARKGFENKTSVKQTKSIYLNSREKIKLPDLSQEAEKNLDELVNLAKQDPVGFSKELEESVVRELEKAGVYKESKELIGVNAKQVSTNLTDKLINLSEPGLDKKQTLSLLYTQNPIHQTASLSNPNDGPLTKAISDQAERLALARGAQELSLALENDHALAKTYLSRHVHKDLLSYMYPTSEEVIYFNISGTKNENSISEIKPDQFIRRQFSLLDQRNEVIDLVKEKGFLELKSRSFNALKGSLQKTPWYTDAKVAIAQKVPFLGGKEIPIVGGFLQYKPGLISFWNSNNIPVLATNMSGFIQLGETNLLLTPIFNFKIGSFAINKAVFTTAEGFAGQAFGLNLRNVGVSFIKVSTKTGTKFMLNVTTDTAFQALGQAGTQAVAQTTTQVAAQTATTAATTTTVGGLFATISTAIPVPVLNVIVGAIGAVLGYLGGKAIEWIGNNKEAAIALLSIPLVLAKVPLLLALSPAAFAGVIAIRSNRRGLIGSVSTLLTFLGGSVMGFITQFILILAITIFSLTTLTALVIYIINSGAYVTPSSSTAFASDNPYIKAKKVILPTNAQAVSYENSDLNPSIEVEYQINISPKKSALSNIRINDKCEVISESNSPTCPSPNPPIPGSSVVEIPIGSTYTYTYKRTFTGQVFEDSLTIDTVIIIADVEGYTNNTEATVIATVTIGDPPDECPNDSWPINPGSNVYSVTQGPFATGCSHRHLEAMDIGGNGMNVIAGHSGIATVGLDGCYGKYIDIVSTCGTTAFASRYAHLGVVKISSGNRVVMGQSIAVSDNTGSCTTGAHLHYDFRAPGGGKVPIPVMKRPYLPKDIPTGCCGELDCKTTVP